MIHKLKSAIAQCAPITLWRLEPTLNRNIWEFYFIASGPLRVCTNANVFRFVGKGHLKDLAHTVCQDGAYLSSLASMYHHEQHACNVTPCAAVCKATCSDASYFFTFFVRLSPLFIFSLFCWWRGEIRTLLHVSHSYSQHSLCSLNIPYHLLQQTSYYLINTV